MIKYIIIFLLLVNCKKQKAEIKDYGTFKASDKSLVVPLIISNYKNYGELIDEIREVTCNDSIPKIVLKQEKPTRNIYPVEHCEPIIFDPQEKHYVSFANGNFYKNHFSKEIKLDSLDGILKNDFAYFKLENGIKVLKSYLVIIESNRNEKIDGIEIFITELAQEYDKLNTQAELNISFSEVVPFSESIEIENDV